MPKVSVLTPIFNTNPTHLRECIDSILGQTFTDFEFIILNDSPENTELDSLVKSYKDKRIKYIKSDKNMGIAAARNKLLEQARGEYIAIFDHDDISVPTRLAQQVAVLDANPEIGVVSGWLELFGDEKSVYKAPENDVDIKIMMTLNCYCFHTAAMIRKSVLQDNNIQYESFYTPCEDYKLWARLMGHTHFYNIQQVLVQYRTHKMRTSNLHARHMEDISRAIQMEIRNAFPAYYDAMRRQDKFPIGVTWRARLFGKIPLLKIKNNRVYLFGCIPVVKITYK